MCINDLCLFGKTKAREFVKKRSLMPNETKRTLHTLYERKIRAIIGDYLSEGVSLVSINCALKGLETKKVSTTDSRISRPVRTKEPTLLCYLARVSRDPRSSRCVSLRHGVSPLRPSSAALSASSNSPMSIDVQSSLLSPALLSQVVFLLVSFTVIRR